MIEKIVLDYLTDCLSVPVYMEMPEEPPASFVLLEKTGSSRRDWIDEATLAIQSYGATLLEAASLNEAVKTAMQSITDLASVSRAELNSDYNYTDTTSKRYRYQAVYDFVYFD